MYNLKVHVRNKHENNKNQTYNNSAPSALHVGDNGRRAPTTIHAQPTQFGSGIMRTNDPTLHCESGPAQVYDSTPKTVPNEEYNKATENARGWNNAHVNLNNQTGSGVISAEEVHKHASEAIRNWDIALQQENEKKKTIRRRISL